MGVSLSKGQSVSLVKSGGGGLTQVRMGLGWDAMKKRGLFGKRSQSIDLDASALLFDAAGKLVDQVWFQQLTSRDGSVQHTGDNVTGEGEGDDESIRVHLDGVPPAVQTIVFTVNSFTGHDFSQIENAFCRLVDETTETEVARYDLTGTGGHTAQIMSKVSRAASSPQNASPQNASPQNASPQNAWTMTAIGATASGRTFHDLLPTIAGYL